MNQSNIIDKINIISFDVTTVTGGISREASEDKNVFTAGSVRYIDPIHLRPFVAARQAGNRACRARGVRFLSGWAIPDVSVDSLVAELNDIAAGVKTAKHDLVANWDANKQHWLDINPQISSYKSRFPTAQYADRATDVSLSVYRIHPTAVKTNAEDGIGVEVKGLAQRVLVEISQDILDTWDPSQVQASQRIKNLLSRVANKFRTLEFLGGNLAVLAKYVNDAIERLPMEGPIKGDDYLTLAGVLGILSSPEKMAKTAIGVKATEDAETDENLVPEIAIAEPITQPMVDAEQIVVEVKPALPEAIVAEEPKVVDPVVQPKRTQVKAAQPEKNSSEAWGF